MEVIDAVRHYQRSIEKCAGNEERMLHCLGKLYNLPVTVQHLQETGVGRTVNALRKYEGDTGEAAKALVIKWKEMVAAEDESDDEEVNGNGSDVGEPEPEPEPEPDPDPEPEAHRVSSHKHKSSKSNHRKEESHHSDKYKSAHKNHVSSSHKSKDKSNYKTSQHKEHSHKRKSTDEDTKSDSKRKKKSTEEAWKRDSSSDETSGDQQEEENEHSSGQDSSSDVEGVNDRLEGGEEEEEEEVSSEEEIEVKKKLHKNREDRSDSHDSYRKRNKNEERESKSDDSRGNEKKSKVCHRSEGKTSSSSSSSGKDEKGKVKSKERHRHTERKKEELDKQVREHRQEKEKLKRKSDAVKHDCKAGSSSHKENSTKHEGKSKDSSAPKKLKVVGGSEDGIDSCSGTSFADALGMMEMVEKKKKKKPTETGGSGSSRKESSRRSEGSTANTATSRSGSSSSHETGSSSHRQSSLKKTSSSSNLNLLAPTTKLEPLHLEEEEMEVDVDATLPTITPHYRPLPHANFDATGASRSRSRPLSEEEALSQVMSTKNQRTKVYSGVKSGKSWSRVPSLYDICIRILQENIEALEYTGGVPYDLLKPVLAHATPDQLNNLEEYNAYLVEDTDELWEKHCQNKFRNSCRQEMESHREMYQRCCREREAKLKELTANIHNSMAKSTPVRQTKLAYVDSIAKPPRQVARKQAKYGTAHATASSPMAKVQKLASPSGGGGGGSGGSGSGLAVHVPPPRLHNSSVAKGKPRMAPLMQKTMKLAKSFKR